MILIQIAVWSLLVVLALNAVLTILSIDQPRRPITRSAAVVIAVLDTIWIGALFALLIRS